MEGNSKKNNRNSKKKKKVEIVFDPEARREFLTGFHKRKMERKFKFQEDLKKQIIQERKRIKHEAKDSYKSMIKSYQTVPEVEHLLKVEEHDLGSHSVEIKELSTKELAEQNNWIGPNETTYVKEDPDPESDKSEAEPESEIPGMDLKRKPVKAKKEEKSNVEDEKVQYNSKKEVKKVIRNEATRQVKKSKAYQLKNKLDQIKSRKKSLQQVKRRIKGKEGGKKGKRAKRVKCLNRQKYGN